MHSSRQVYLDAVGVTLLAVVLIVVLVRPTAVETIKSRGRPGAAATTPRRLSTPNATSNSTPGTNKCQWSPWWIGKGGSGVCLCTADELLEAVEAVPSASFDDGTSSSTETTLIVLCRSSHVELNVAMDVSNKDVALQCGGGGSAAPSDLTSASSNGIGGSLFWNGGGEDGLDGDSADPDLDPCIIDGMGRTRLFTGTNARLSLQGIRLVNGRATPTNGSESNNGGAIALIRSNLTLGQCHLAHHTAPMGAGGAVYIQSGRLKSTHTVWFNNSAPDGGALAVKGSRSSSSSHVALYSNAFGHNAATAGGAGIFQGGIVLVNYTLFVANTAASKFGGALALHNVKMNLSYSTFADNVAETTASASSWDVTIVDDTRPGRGGTALICEGTVFCTNSNTSTTIESTGQSDNTNCDTIAATEKEGRCPVN